MECILYNIFWCLSYSGHYLKWWMHLTISVPYREQDFFTSLFLQILCKVKAFGKCLTRLLQVSSAWTTSGFANDAWAKCYRMYAGAKTEIVFNTTTSGIEATHIWLFSTQFWGKWQNNYFLRVVKCGQYRDLKRRIMEEQKSNLKTCRLPYLSDNGRYIPRKKPPCLNMIIAEQPNFMLGYGALPSSLSYCHHLIIYGTINFRIIPIPPYWHFNT